MNIKKFSFLPFDEWNKKHEFKQKIGNYTCAIEIFSWGCNGNNENTYIAAIAANDNPTNIYVHKVIFNTFTCDRANKEALREWYEKVTIYLNEQWEQYVLNTYFLAETT